MKRTLLCVWMSLCLIFALLPTAQAESPENYLEDERFTFSPMEFTKRFEKIAKESFPEIRFEDASGDGYSLLVDWGAGAAVEDAQYMLQFFHEDSRSFTKEEARNPGVWCVYLVSMKQLEESTPATEETQAPGALHADLVSAKQVEIRPVTMLSKEMLWIFCQACDPSMTKGDFQDLMAVNIASHMNTLSGEDPFGYYQTPGGFYEFQHIYLLSDEMNVVTDGIGIYGADWR